MIPHRYDGTEIASATESGYGSVAERDLPKVETRVRLPLPAPLEEQILFQVDLGLQRARRLPFVFPAVEIGAIQIVISEDGHK